MNAKKIVLSGIAVFVAFFVLEFLIHGVLIKPLYDATVDVWRPHEYAQKLMGLMALGQLVFAFVFVFIYTKGFEPAKAGIGQGMRFGFLIGLLTAPLSALLWYVVLPIPETLAAAWFVAGMVECLVAGAVAGLLYR